MAFQVRLLQYGKRPNSTRDPFLGQTQGVLTEAVSLKEGSSIINPELSFRDRPGITHRLYNYATIPDFGGRRYYISDWYFENGLWWASMSIDELATYRSSILASKQYVTRSASKWDDEILDEKYPAKANCVVGNSTFTGQFYPSWDVGVYIIGVINGETTSSTGAVTYYMLLPQQMTALKALLFGTDVSWGQTSDLVQAFAGASSAVFKMMVNPYQFLTGCWYIPIPWQNFASLNKTIVGQIKFGYWTLQAQGYRLEEKLFKFANNIVIPKHPQAASRGNWLLYEPYSTYTMFYPPFGSFEIPATLLAKQSKINISGVIDLTTGDIQIHGVAQRRVFIKYGNCSVPVQLAGMSYDRSIQGALGGYFSEIGKLNTKTGVQFVDDIFKDITDAASVATANMTTAGANGSLVNYVQDPYLELRAAIVVPEAIDKIGRPLCQNVALSTLSGYCVVADPDLIMIPGATQAEIERIAEKMSTGFYIE